jgi:hypothetical protein
MHLAVTPNLFFLGLPSDRLVVFLVRVEGG